ncbi:hypothetical protein FKM82_022604 [Ascaphus truei]
MRTGVEHPCSEVINEQAVSPTAASFLRRRWAAILNPFLLCRFPAANVCDNELLRCQNGGVCYNNVRCHCAAGYAGILCEKLKCEDTGSCASKSGQEPSPVNPRLALTAPLLAAWLCTF